MGWVGPGRVGWAQDVIGPGGLQHLAGRVGSGRVGWSQGVFEISPVGSGGVRLGDSTRPDPRGLTRPVNNREQTAQSLKSISQSVNQSIHQFTSDR